MQFKLALSATQGMGLVQALVFAVVIGPGRITDSLTLLIMLAQTPISVVSFGALYSFAVGNPSFKSWRAAKLGIAPFGLLSPLVIIPFEIVSDNSDRRFVFLIVCFCISSLINSISSVKIVELACLGRPNWFACQSIGNSLAISLGYAIPAQPSELFAGIFLILNSIIISKLVSISRSRITEVKNGSTFENTSHDIAKFIFQIIRSSIGYVGPILLLLAISRWSVGAITVIAIVNKIAQSLINLTANSKVHTGSFDAKESMLLVSNARKYIIISTLAIFTSNVLLWFSNFEDRGLVLVSEFWVGMCIIEIFLNRVINFSSSLVIIRFAALMGAVGFTGAYTFLLSNPKVDNFYLAYSCAILMASILPAFFLLTQRNRLMFGVCILGSLYISVSRPSIGTSIVLILAMYFLVKRAQHKTHE